jgi:hypothetical protein
VSAILRDEPAPLVAPAPLVPIVRRCLAKQVAQRFPSMHEVKVALEDMSEGSGDRKPSIAVLPFENMSGDKENEYFSDGLAEEIIAAADGSQLWSARYDRELADVFAVQDEIASAITAAFQVTLSARQRRCDSTVQAQPPAYENYLRALHDSQRWTPASLARARACLARAITSDPQFALAHAELGHVFHPLAIYGLMPLRDALPLMREECGKRWR